MTVDLGQQQFIAGLTVFGDDNDYTKFYVMPDKPLFRVDTTTKKPVFKFIKYKLPVDRPDGKKGGGFVVFDCAFTVPDDVLKQIQSALDSQVQSKHPGGGVTSARIEHIPFTDATASLTLLDTSGVLVSKINSPGKPSVFGSMICPFTAELTPEGATVIEAAMSGSGGVAQVSYDLHFPATFPPITGSIWFNATKFYSFSQSIDKSGGSWDSSNDTEHDKMQQDFISSSCGNVNFDYESLGYITDDATRTKVHDAISNWGWGQIDAATKAVALPDIKPTDDTGDHGMDHITKSNTTFEAASFYRTINEREGISFETNQGGTLPNLVDMGFKWADYCIEVDANDPFFATISTSVAVNADFDKYGINSVDIHCEYTKTNPATVKDFHFTKPDDLGKFDADTSNGDMNYAYSFLVNYTDQNKAYQAPLTTTNHTAITINANDLGILYANFSIGNVDFDKTPKVQVAITYPDPDAAGQPISQQFNFDKTKLSEPLVAVLLKPVDKPFTYTVTYIMADGTQMVQPPIESQASEIFINSPFVLHTFSFLAEGDFASSIDNIFLKMSYQDDANKIQQSSDYVFKADTRQKDWIIPIVANSAGEITYSGAITYKNHTTENIPPTSTTNDLIEFGPPNQVIITVAPDTTMIDFTQVKLITVNLEYQDAANQIDVKQEFKLLNGTTPVPWTFYARDPQKTDYTWSANFFMATTPPTIKKTAPVTSSDTDLILMMPS